MDLHSSIKEIKGIGPKIALYFQKLGIETVQDLLMYFPRNYDVFEPPVAVAQTQYRDFASVYGVITATPKVQRFQKMQITSAILQDEQGDRLKLTWFNMPYLQKTLRAGMHYVCRGRLKGAGASRCMEQPKLYSLGTYEELQKSMQPVYSTTSGLSGQTIQKSIRKVLDEGIACKDTLDERLRKEYDLWPMERAVEEIHFPESKETLIPARKRLVFQEFYTFLLNVRRRKEAALQEANSFFIQEKEEVQELAEKLPYALTGAQQRVLKEIGQDLTGPNVMNRLIQGDVGSGKTIVAFLTMYQVALNGYQSALMAPTEVLAAQHYANFVALSEKYDLGLNIVLLTGSQKASEKKKIYEQISNHQVDIIVGTHALIQGKVHYEDLALVVTDEQHRFGVRQREILSEKGQNPHVLVMSATPIPRTLALILYSDLDISVMNELPAHRLPIKNAIVDITYRPKAYDFMKKQVAAGHQVYVICPMVAASEFSEGENVTDYGKMLQKELGSQIRVSILHGKMKNEEKEEIMEAFARNEIQVLVSTTVIEVGIDVANATVMMIEDAQRFGLAQLHQLRGRVGRGDSQSYCIFVDTASTEESKKRLGVLGKSNDGFYIASEDLKMRGPGDFFGVRQSGEMLFRLGDIYTDAEILQQASKAADQTLVMEQELVEKIIL